MATGLSDLPRSKVLVFTGVVAILLVWRVLAAGIDAWSERYGTRGLEVSSKSPSPEEMERSLRERIARDPADATALLVLALTLEQQEKPDDGAAAMNQALLLAPHDSQTLMQAAGFFLRIGEEEQALETLRRAVDSQTREINGGVWPVFAAALDTGRHREFFDTLARDDPKWWPKFFSHVCVHATNSAAIEAIFAARVSTSLASPDERRCMLDRMQRDGRWTNAYQLWINTLPLDQRQKIGYVFNGGFELPLTNLGFDWRIQNQDGVNVTTESTDGMTGKRALAVSFGNKRYGGPPIYQYLMLYPGRYSLEGRGRIDLESLLAVQWGLYCNDPQGHEMRALAHSDRFVGMVEWRKFRQEFVVPSDCPVQLLRLELANPRYDTSAAGAMGVKLKGKAWFDDLRVRLLD